MKAKKLAKQAIGLGTGSWTSSLAVQIAGASAKRGGAAIVLHGLKVLGLGSMGMGIVVTGGIAIVTFVAVTALLDEIFE